MSKQDIEKRLGFAAQGVKAEMGSSQVNDSATTADLIREAQRLRDVIKTSNREFDKTNLRQIKQELDKRGVLMPYGASEVLAARPGAKAKMALTIYTVGAKNACYEALANLGELAKLASETNSGWDFHVNVMTDHVKDAIARMETKPTQAARDLDKAVDTLGMLKKIEPKRLNDNQKGSFKQLIGYVAKSLRDAKANIKVVTTASRPGVKIKFSAQFEVGRVYEHSFIGDYDAIVQWKVLSRTASTLTVKKVGEGNRNSVTTPTRGEEKRVKINSDAQGEFVYPMGKFSMAPILRASKTTASRPGVKATFAEFNVGDKVVYVPDSSHIDAYGRIIKIENGIATIASAEGNVKAKLSDLELVKKGSVEDLRRLGMKGFARPGVKAKAKA